MYMSFKENIGNNLKNISVKYNRKYKIVNLQTIELLSNDYDLSKNIHLTSIIENNITYDYLFHIVKIIIERFKDYDFWWYEHEEVRIDYELHTGFINLKKIFKVLNKESKLSFVDNNLSIGNYNKKLNYYGVPGMIGYTHSNINLSKYRDFNKKFICLNRTPKYHRKIIFDFLKNNYKEDCYLSFAPHLDSKEKRYTLLENDVDVTTNLKAFVNDYQYSSFCNIVTESIFMDKIIHITEKTDKCFSAGQPFILVAGPNYLKKLKELGFKTFDRWWDESYDIETDNEKRLDLIKNTISMIGGWSYKKCSEVYEDMIPILKHNMKIQKKYSKISKYHCEYYSVAKINIR